MNTENILKGTRYQLECDDTRYPDSFRALECPPKCLYVIGNVKALRPGLAIIGARRATPYGMSCAHHFARIAAEKGACIISGGARGCDSEAHRATLKAKGQTVVFLGGGCDCVYPPEHTNLFQEVIDAGGAVVSEQSWDVKPKPYMFRMRNRLIAGLAEAVLIVEAGLPSGTFSTADEALAAGKEVLVIPGAITSQASHGANRLLYQGALPVVDDESFEDLLFSLLHILKCPHAQDCMHDTKINDVSNDPILRAVLAAPVTSDELYDYAVKTYGVEQARIALTEALAVAEANHIIARLPDGRWAPVVQH